MTGDAAPDRATEEEPADEDMADRSSDEKEKGRGSGARPVGHLGA
jgi:hypothetical protein